MMQGDPSQHVNAQRRASLSRSTSSLRRQSLENLTSNSKSHSTTKLSVAGVGGGIPNQTTTSSLDAAKKAYSAAVVPTSAPGRRKSAGNVVSFAGFSAGRESRNGGGSHSAYPSRVEVNSSKEHLVQPKITYSRECQQVTEDEERIIKERKAMELPKSSQIVKDLKINGLLFLYSNIQSLFDSLVKAYASIDKTSEDIKGIYIMLLRFFCDYVAYVQMYLKSSDVANSAVDEIYNKLFSILNTITNPTSNSSALDHFHHFFESIKLWVECTLYFSNFLRDREIKIEKFVTDFESMEEETMIFKDVLKKAPQACCGIDGNPGSHRIEIVVRHITSFQSTRSNVAKRANTCDKETTTDNLIASPSITASLATSRNSVKILGSNETVTSEYSETSTDTLSSDYANNEDPKISRSTESMMSVLEEESSVYSGGSTDFPRPKSIYTSIRNSVPAIKTEEYQEPVRTSVASEKKSRQSFILEEALDDSEEEEDEDLTPYNPDTTNVSVGPNRPMPKFANALVQVDTPDQNYELKIKQYRKQIESYEKQLKEKAENYERDLDSLREENEMRLKSEKMKFDDIVVEQGKRLRKLEEQCQRVEESLVFSEKCREDQAEELGTVTKERDELLGRVKDFSEKEQKLSIIEEEFLELQQEHSTVTQTLESLSASHNELIDQRNEAVASRDEAIAQMLLYEQEKGRLEVTTREATEAWESSKARMGDLHHSLVTAREENEQLQDRNQALEVTAKTSQYRIKELEAMVNAMMRYPDASLGQVLQEPNSEDYDQLYHELINSNNMRIALLEQKNNEYRFMRLRKAADLKDEKRRQKIKEGGGKTRLWKHEDITRAADKAITVPSTRSTEEDGVDMESTLLKTYHQPTIEVAEHGYYAATAGIPPNIEALQKAFAQRMGGPSENAKAAVDTYAKLKSKSATARAPATLRAPPTQTLQLPSAVFSTHRSKQNAYDYVTDVSAGYVAPILTPSLKSPSLPRSSRAPTPGQHHVSEFDTSFPDEYRKLAATPASERTAYEDTLSYRGSPLPRCGTPSSSKSRPNSARMKVPSSAMRSIFSEVAGAPVGGKGGGVGVRWRGSGEGIAGFGMGPMKRE
ncbi:hypothetical protein HDV05_001730 [Chytridiales sp. JEL 0842]|nr:hypothetical protein HDV05_001730 [Chytridiales sp. JEL 0842]